MTETVDIEVHYTLHLSEANFKKVMSYAREMGLAFNDAGQLLMVRRLLQREGIDALDEFLEDLQAIKVTEHPVTLKEDFISKHKY